MNVQSFVRVELSKYQTPLSFESQRNIIKRLFKKILEEYLEKHCVVELWEVSYRIMFHEYYHTFYFNLLQCRKEFIEVLKFFDRDMNEFDEKVVIYFCTNYASSGSNKQRLDSLMFHVTSRYRHCVNTNVLYACLRDVSSRMICGDDRYFNKLYEQHMR